MSDEPSPIVAANAGEFGARALSADAIEAILADFRAWLVEAADADASSHADVPELEAGGFDVASVLQHFIALRQEINLQTRASRGQLEQNSQTIALLQESLGTLQQQQAKREESGGADPDEILRPLLKTLIDAHDSLWIAERQVRRLLENPPPPAAAATPISAPPVIKLKIPHWARWMGLDVSIEAQLAPLYAWRQGQLSAAPDTGEDRYRKSLDALLTGYGMSMQRIERTLAQHGLEAFPCVGEPFDPEIMEVAEVVRVAGRARTEVIEELRRGYRWRGRLFRCAQVRVAKS